MPRLTREKFDSFQSTAQTMNVYENNSHHPNIYITCRVSNLSSKFVYGILTKLSAFIWWRESVIWTTAIAWAWCWIFSFRSDTPFIELETTAWKNYEPMTKHYIYKSSLLLTSKVQLWRFEYPLSVGLSSCQWNYFRLRSKNPW